jgi:hypothetical protein
MEKPLPGSGSRGYGVALSKESDRLARLILAAVQVLLLAFLPSAIHPIDTRIRAESFKDASVTPSPSGRGLG